MILPQYTALISVGVIALLGSTCVASASQVHERIWHEDGVTKIKRDLRLTHPSRWANDKMNDEPALGDASTGTVNGDSWRTNRAATNGGGMHALYLQGEIDSMDPADADPAAGVSPQLLFDPSMSNGGAGPLVSDITRVAWDTMRSGQSNDGGHWFFNIVTDAGTNLNYALTDDSNYNDGQWNTLQGIEYPQNGDAANEIRLFDHQRVTTGDHDKYPAKTLAGWAATTGANNTMGENEPEWWGEHIDRAFLGTARGANNGDSQFYSNLDNIAFEYETADGICAKTFIDLGADNDATHDVAEPGNLALMAFGLGLVVVLSGRRKRIG